MSEKFIDREYLLDSFKDYNTDIVEKKFDQVNSNLSVLETNLGDLKKEEVDKKIESEVATDFSQADTPQFQQTIDDVQNEVNELKGDLIRYETVLIDNIFNENVGIEYGSINTTNGMPNNTTNHIICNIKFCVSTIIINIHRTILSINVVI